MTSSSDTFPFGIADVVELLGLTVRRRLPSSLYLNCPFCGDQRGRLNVNTDKNVWRCNRCGAAGGMLALYAHYYCTSNDGHRKNDDDSQKCFALLHWDSPLISCNPPVRGNRPR